MIPRSLRRSTGDTTGMPRSQVKACTGVTIAAHLISGDVGLGVVSAPVTAVRGRYCWRRRKATSARRKGAEARYRGNRVPTAHPGTIRILSSEEGAPDMGAGLSWISRDWLCLADSNHRLIDSFPGCGYVSLASSPLKARLVLASRSSGSGIYLYVLESEGPLAVAVFLRIDSSISCRLGVPVPDRVSTCTSCCARNR